MSVILASMVPNALHDQRIDWTRLRISQATSSGDPNAIEDPANTFADQADGSIEGGLLGGTATTDPGSARWWTWRASDIFNQLMTGAALYQHIEMLREVTAPGLSTDTFVSIGICNEANLNSATVDAAGISFRYTGASRGSGVLRILNGAVTLTNDGAPVGTMRRLLHTTNKGTTGADFGQQHALGFTDAGVVVAGENVAANVYIDISGDLYWYLAFGRLAATAGTVAVAHSAFVLGYPSPRSGFAPT